MQKLRKYIKQVLLEIGDGSAGGYEFDKRPNRIEKGSGLNAMGKVEYSFIGPGRHGQNYYFVVIQENKLTGSARVHFGRDYGEPGEMTNKHKALKVLTTVCNIVKHWGQERVMYPRGIRKIIITAAQKDNENIENNQRMKLYKKFIKRQFRKAKVEDVGDSVHVTQIDSYINRESEPYGESGRW